MVNIVDEAHAGRIEGVRQALEEGQDVNQKDRTGDTALLWAIANNRVEIVQLLVNYGADVMLANPSNHITPMAFAQTKGNSEIIRILNAGPVNPPEPPKAVETWKKMGAATVAHVGTYPAIDEKLTSVFNFASRERFIISEGLTSHNKAVGPSTGFDALPQEMLVEALGQFEKLGGSADREYVLGGRSTLDKPKMKLPVA